ncbi:MAG: LTA synthase family protein [Opitutaceae bacterium]|nr:LTA synthase family protein [Opitutaceae bacterium]
MSARQTSPMASLPPSPASGFSRIWLRLLDSRHGGLALFALVFVGVAQLTRLALLGKSAGEVTWNLSLLASFAWGLLYDVGAAGFALLPLAVILTLLPAGCFRRKAGRIAAHLAGLALLYALIFAAVAEWTFWDEFGVRPNFIAVDYLVYTTEVIGNIRESYNLPLILAGVLGGTLLLGGALLATGWPTRWLAAAAQPARPRLAAGSGWVAAGLAVGIVLNADQLPGFANNYNRELAKNGFWSFFAAFRNNALDYQQFYRTLPRDEVFDHLRAELIEDGSILLRPGAPDTLRYVKNHGPELRPNVIQITVESLSADFLSVFNRASRLTPELEKLAAHSLVFDRFYATGTRTDRGMEALTLSLPPTPGRSIVKRPNNENMFTLGSVFRAKGYETTFLYGGFGYFDNMNYFFGHNGYRVIDRNSVAPEDVTFANVWGACDEDLFRWTLREADAAFARGKPFHHFVMTTSNHRPYTFPEGRIDLPSKVSGRAGAVKYTDYAIGRFIRDASTRPWFRDTVFVIVADHCAASAGKTELPVENYHIPLLIYAPGGQIPPGRVPTLMSQIDYGPTLLGLLNWSYPSRFFGHDVRRIPEQDAHALIGNYQKLGHLEGGRFVVLQPQKSQTTYHYDFRTGLQPAPHDEAAERQAIAFYCAASYLYENRLYRALTSDEFTRYSATGESKAASSYALAEKPK